MQNLAEHDDPMDLSEAEIQVLASLERAHLEGQANDRASLEKGGERYWIFREDWAEAFARLLARGLIEGHDGGYFLTAAGRPLAIAYYRERPDRYWYYYQRFYPDAQASDAHSRLCERVFGRDLCQDGMTDMDALHDLLDRLDLKPESHLLDLGCGVGRIAEYISERTGAKVTGLDYAASAITEAQRRGADKRSRLTFLEGDMNRLELPAQTFDAAISLDTLYWVEDLSETLSQIVRTIKPGGQIGIFMMQGPGDDTAPGTLMAGKTELGKALSELKLTYEAEDYTARNVAFWRRNWQAAVDLREAFEAEGNGYIAESLIKEAEEEFLPAIKLQKMTRYLYHVQL